MKRVILKQSNYHFFIVKLKSSIFWFYYLIENKTIKNLFHQACNNMDTFFSFNYISKLTFKYFAEMSLVKSSVYIIFIKSYQFPTVREQRNIYKNWGLLCMWNKIQYTLSTPNHCYSYYFISFLKGCHIL